MQIREMASHRQASLILGRLKYDQKILAAIEDPSIAIGRRSSSAIKARISDELIADGWASHVLVSEGADVSLNLILNKVTVQIQTGNIARAFYDLMKMQAMHDENRAVCGVLVVPTAAAAKRMGSNLAQYERVAKELRDVFFRQITIPVLVVGIE